MKALGFLLFSDVAHKRKPFKGLLDTDIIWMVAHPLFQFLLLGLKYDPEVSGRLLKGVLEMKESSTYQAILEEGAAQAEARYRADWARKILLRQGTRRFGTPDQKIVAEIEAISSVDILEALIDRVYDAENWNELLAGSAQAK